MSLVREPMERGGQRVCDRASGRSLDAKGCKVWKPDGPYEGRRAQALCYHSVVRINHELFLFIIRYVLKIN